jgi:hypothetical protein
LAPETQIRRGPKFTDFEEDIGIPGEVVNVNGAWMYMILYYFVKRS